MDIIMEKEIKMHGESSLEYMCPHCGAINTCQIGILKEMYIEQFDACVGCKKHLSLTPADGIGGRVNLVIDAVESDNRYR
ncbi:hypothetical protein [Alteromonas hispanica]|uniref:CPXCG motif-containing cysteine-rich protein n=1 Tax=Alteromonas hispanica TaxID=315421 RepID=A0A6L9MSL4_9ALTE|nr:hypothetical protein [Alteromonas hispanica]NDW21087.1 hypothetical protein [Alteromonas hispanica]